MSADEQRPPLLRVVRGEPTEAELAALVAVVASAAARAAASRPTEPRPKRRRWAAPTPRPALRPGPGAWAASAVTR